MSDALRAEVKGVADVREALMGVAPKLKVRALRNALTAGARLVQRAARKATPVLDLSKEWSASAYRKGYRKPGTVQKAISVRTSKLARRQGNVGVFVNVKPAKRGQAGAKSFRDPFYWRWLDKGWTPARGPRQPGRNILKAGAAMLGAALAEFNRRIPLAIAKLNKPKAPAP